MPLRLLLCFLVVALAAPSSGLCAPTLREMAGQMLLVGFRGTTVGDNHWISRAIREQNLGGVILFDYDVALEKPVRNIVDKEQVKALTTQLSSRASTPLFVAVDMEGGRVQRLKPAHGYPDFPSAAKLGKRLPCDIVATAKSMGKQLRESGFNLDFAPVVDVNVDPESPAIGRIERSFSANPAMVATDAAAFIEGLHSEGVLSCVKHFPGHGSARADSHLGLTDVTTTWTKRELTPYRQLVDTRALDMVMTAHIFNAQLDPDHPATLSKRIVTDLLRNDIGFDGVVVTDDLQMKAVADHYGLEKTIELALNAGCDILLFGNNLSHDRQIVTRSLDIIEKLVREGQVEEKRIREAYGRIMQLKQKL